MVAALLATTSIAAAKFLAFFRTGTSSTLAEATLSVADGVPATAREVATATYQAERAVRTTEPSPAVIHLVPDVDRDPVS